MPAYCIQPRCATCLFALHALAWCGPRWSSAILDECFRTIQARRPELDPAALARTRSLMETALPDAGVTGFESLIEALKLRDADDRHVLAAAVRGGAQAIVTFNLDDFPPAELERYHIEAKHPDDFVLDAVDLAPGPVLRVLTEQAADLRRPPMSVEALLEVLWKLGLVRAVARFRELLAN